jgi:tRNA acetyltransferase TAN1
MLIVVTSRPGKEKRAFNEIMDLLISNNIYASQSPIFNSSGVVVIDADCNMFMLAECLKKYRRFYALKVMPIQLVVNNTLEDLANGVIYLMRNIKGSFAVRATKRGNISAKSIEEYVGKVILEKLGLNVNLRNPDHIIVIEGLGLKAGIVVLNPEMYLLFAKKKRI